MRFTQSGLCFCAVLIAVLHAAPSISAAGETHDAAFWKAAVAIQEKLALGVGGLFLTSFSGNSGAKFSKEVVRVRSS